MMIFRNNKSHFTDILDDCLTFGYASDVTLVACDGECFLGHKFALSAASPVLKGILMEMKSENTSLVFADTNRILLKALLYYIYLGNVKLSAKYVADLSLFIESLGIEPGFSEMEIDKEHTVNQLDTIESFEESLEETDIDFETKTDIKKIINSDSIENVDTFGKFELLAKKNQIVPASRTFNYTHYTSNTGKKNSQNRLIL